MERETTFESTENERNEPEFNNDYMPVRVQK